MRRQNFLRQIEDHPRETNRDDSDITTPTEPVDICQHRGALLREEASKLCGGCGRVTQVFACELHKECTPLRTDRLIRSCMSCEDNTAHGLGGNQHIATSQTSR